MHADWMDRRHGWWALVLFGCTSGGGDTAAECSRDTGSLTVSIMGSWGAPYEDATDIRVDPEGEESYLVSVNGASVNIELPAGAYGISMDENAEACLSFEPVTVRVRPCGEHEVRLEIDCAL